MRATSTSITGPRHVRRARTGGKRATIAIAAAIGAGILVALLAGTSHQAGDMAGTTSITSDPTVTGLETATTIRPSNDPTINVTGNAQLAAVADRGSGTPADPYVIENRVIDAGGSYPGILITSTSAHLIIRDCTVMNMREDGFFPEINGISLYSCANVTLARNDLLAGGNGIYMYSVAQITLTGNKLGRLMAESVQHALITGNSMVMISVLGGNNMIWNNSFASPCLDVWGFGGYGDNIDWDNGTHGNYWYDYQERYPNAKHDGVTWDTPYTFYVDAADNHPLVHDPFARPAVPGAPVAWMVLALLAGAGVASIGYIHKMIVRKGENEP